MFGLLNTGEPHPSAVEALHWIQGLPGDELAKAMEAFSSCAIEGNRLGEVCSETLRRLVIGEKVSDRYILGLAWALKTLQKEKADENPL